MGTSAGDQGRQDKREQMLEAALTEYVEKYGATDRARLALTMERAAPDHFQPLHPVLAAAKARRAAGLLAVARLREQRG